MPLKLYGQGLGEGWERVGRGVGERVGRGGGVITTEKEKVGEELGNYSSLVVCHKGSVRGSPVARYSQCSLAYAIVW